MEEEGEGGGREGKTAYLDARTSLGELEERLGGGGCPQEGVEGQERGGSWL